MRLLYITSSFPYGWGEAFIAPEVAALRQIGHEVAVVPMNPQGALRHRDATALTDAALKTALLSPKVLYGASRCALRSPATVGGAIGLLRESGTVRLLAKNAAVVPKALWLARIAREWKADHLHAHWATTTASLGLIAAEVADVAWSFTAHRWDILEPNLFQIKADRAAFVRFISRSGLSDARERGIQLSDERTTVIPMGVDVPDQTGPQVTDAGGCGVVLCPGFLRPVKGHRYLIDAWAILRDQGLELKLILLGDGPLRDALAAQVREHRLARLVSFGGTLPHHELLRWYRDRPPLLTVLPSLHEGVPVSLMEAMAHRIPVVATDVGGVAELVTDGSGVLVPPRDPAAIADAVAKLATDEQTRDRLATAGRRRIEEGFNVLPIARRLASKFASGTAA